MTPSPAPFPTMMPSASDPSLQPSPDSGMAAQRDGRLTSILLVAQLARETGDNLCRIRNLSSGGMRIETQSPLAAGERVSIAMKNGAIVAGAVTWTLTPEAGVQFDAPVDVAELLAIGARQPRTLRFAARCPVMLRRDGYLVPAVLTDISQGGVKLSLAAPGHAGDSGMLAIPGLETRRVAVRWTGDGTAGLVFEAPLAFAALTAWLSGDRRFSATEATAAEE